MFPYDSVWRVPEDDGEADSAKAEDGARGALLHLGRVQRRADPLHPINVSHVSKISAMSAVCVRNVSNVCQRWMWRRRARLHLGRVQRCADALPAPPGQAPGQGPRTSHPRFRVQGLGFGIEGIQGLGFGVEDFLFRVWD